VKYSVILPKTESTFVLLSHFTLDTKSFFLKHINSATRFEGNPRPFLSTLSHFISNDRIEVASTWRHGGSEVQGGMEWLSVGASGQSGGDAEARRRGGTGIGGVTFWSRGCDMEAR
jgi:hypothetical protein